MQVGLFFGSFNPFHLGHLNLGKYLVENKMFDEVWYIVSPFNPFKNQTDLIDENIRLEMIVGAIQYEKNLKASDIEFTMTIPSYTIDTLNLLSESYSNHSFTLLIGSDNALVFDKWKNYIELLQNYKILVYPRTGYNFNTVSSIYPQMKLVDCPIYDISSTSIRQLIAQKKDVSNLVHPFVNQFIIENKLYQV
jgi:nicotinate-nucleotide adenylyltransferase